MSEVFCIPSQCGDIERGLAGLSGSELVMSTELSRGEKPLAGGGDGCVKVSTCVKMSV